MQTRPISPQQRSWSRVRFYAFAMTFASIFLESSKAIILNKTRVGNPRTWPKIRLSWIRRSRTKMRKYSSTSTRSKRTKRKKRKTKKRKSPSSRAANRNMIHSSGSQNTAEPTNALCMNYCHWRITHIQPFDFGRYHCWKTNCWTIQAIHFLTFPLLTFWTVSLIRSQNQLQNWLNCESKSMWDRLIMKNQ